MTQGKEIALQVHVDLPEDLFEADLAKSKFGETIGFLKTIVSEIEEARCKVKVIHSPGKKSHYELNVSIITPHKLDTYAKSGWDLAMIVNEMSDSLKKRFAQEKQMKNLRKSARNA